jgi:uncharacterized metal-binding protein
MPDLNLNAQDARAPSAAAPKSRVIIYSCSGGSDAGELADRTARELSRAKVGEMSCLAGIGGRVKPLMNRAAQAEQILVIDGCPLNCARHTLEGAGFKTFQHFELHRIGLRKGDCPPTQESVERAVKAATAMVRNPPNPETSDQA